MDTKQIDHLSRLLATGVQRRPVLAGLLVGLGFHFHDSEVRTASAACKKVGRNCDKNRDCCDHAKCKRKHCRCKNGFKNCSKKCVDLDTDEQHCGTCNTRCLANEQCCDGKCVDLQTNDDHCVVCGRRCGEDEECVGGNCLPPATGCPAGFDGCAGGGQTFCGATGNCRCHQSTERATVCIDALTPGLACGQCETSDDCDTGAVCVQTVPDGSCCTLAGGNFCARTCAT